ncbi:protein FAR1-RELATED SEQUENCE 5-like [Helianthus annuus]|uniref:protein FAR1-RELATED SEQUENCE 5-like n=1 Tax=Helianthus annuus TaxID=4232 RepID=UPI000B8F3D2A|nr:protein FAR1-RELATED SEQUENCE 5-like [Helianthus annuus]
MDPHSSNARNIDDIEFEDVEVNAGHDAAEQYRNPTSDNHVLLDDDERLYITEVASSCVPVIGMEFSSIEQAYVFYQKYAKKGGFSARKGGEHHVGGIIKTKYFVCSKERHKPQEFDDPYSKLSKPYKRRNRPTIRTGCKAQIKLCSTDGVLYKVDKFVQSHNHSFVCPKDMHLLPAYRHLSETQEEMIWELGTLNLGPVKAFNIMRQRYGGFENVGTTKDDFKNFRAKIHSYIGEYDADMVINRLTDKKQFTADYSFVHSVDENKRLTGLFWADGYKMVFVPFTGIDNHCQNVTLGAGLLASESIESYKWLLQSFLDSFGKQPKVGHELCNNKEFKRCMCDIVWTDSIAPETFEREWKLIMIEFGLIENKWIDDMFGMRSSWILAFYCYEPMSGLTRTISRSESENHFFCQVANSQLTLVEFFNHFDGAMDVQRFNHRKNNHISRNATPDNFSESTLEVDAMKIYTRSIFADQQPELQGTLSECLPMETKIKEPFLKISMKDWKAHGDGLLEVCFKKGEDMFKVKEIPNKYVMRRWTKDVVPNDLNNTFDLSVDDNDAHKKAKEVAYEIMQTGEYLIGNLMKYFDHLLIVRDRMREMKEMVDELRITKPIDPKFDRYSRLIGYKKPNTDAPPTGKASAADKNAGKKGRKRRAIQLENDPGLVDEEDKEVETGEEEEEYEEVDEADDSDSEWEDECVINHNYKRLSESEISNDH